MALGGSPVEVYFDDFNVEHTKSPVVQAEDYYPFGYTFSSYRRENSLLNRYQYNGKELQTDLNLDLYDYGWRSYSAALGRWNQIDPFVDDYEDWSPYNYVLNNPVGHNDPDGRWVNIVVGAIVGAATDYAAQVTVNLIEGKDLGDALTEVDGGSIAVSAVTGALTSGASALAKSTVTIGARAGAQQVAKTTTQKVVQQATKVATITSAKVSAKRQQLSNNKVNGQRGEAKVEKKLEKDLDPGQTILDKPRVVTKNGRTTYPDKVVVDAKKKKVVNPTEIKSGNASLSKGQQDLLDNGGTIQSNKYPEYNGATIKPNQLNVVRVKNN